jgi:hypothetical protein
MGILVKKDLEERGGLHARISAELRDKSLRTQEVEDPDLAADSRYIEGSKQTSRFAWIWAVVVLAAIALLIAILLI